ncbi:MAG: hypothetical protein H0W53_16995 [Acidobacteria bacterium]|nr:hypothetical protein [Acidobacteriota bacterium]
MERNQASEAAREYAAALVAAPGARNASLALAGLAYLDGQHDGAHRLAVAGLTAADFQLLEDGQLVLCQAKIDHHW